MGSDQRKVLLDHGDSQLHGIPGRIDPHLLSIHQNLAAGFMVQSVKDLHDRALAGAVFSQKGDNLSFVDRNGYIVVGQDLGKSLCHMLQFNYRFPHIPVPLLNRRQAVAQIARQPCPVTYYNKDLSRVQASPAVQLLAHFCTPDHSPKYCVKSISPFLIFSIASLTAVMHSSVMASVSARKYTPSATPISTMPV